MKDIYCTGENREVELEVKEENIQTTVCPKGLVTF